ncbi:MAG: hypothetical protein NC218_11710 [Acetobacter sp.]|nr:hypothetical protein [Acetobacter sp.]
MSETFSRVDYKTLCQIFKLREQPLRKAVASIVKKFYDEKDIVATKDFVCAWGEIPVALVAHMDTVHATPPVEIFHDAEQGVIWSPEGIGADDRAGVYAIITLLTDGYRPTVIFTTREEVGGLGAEAFIEMFPQPKVPVNFLVELDRRGKEDMVFYDCDNPDFTEFIGKYGFVEDWGSFSDISVIAPDWEIAAVNLSIGYEDEHTKYERLYYRAMLETIAKVRRILDDAAIESKSFKYIPGVSYGCYGSWNKYSGWGSHYDEQTGAFISTCDGCEEHKKDLKYIYDGGTYWALCPDCLKKMTKKCEKCGNHFIPWEDEETLCSSCRKKKDGKGAGRNVHIL